MMLAFDIQPDGHEFEAKVRTHVTAAPFSTLSIKVGDLNMKLYAKADDALKLIRVATLLNEVFASEKVEAGE
jgi:hypothetical protein